MPREARQSAQQRPALEPSTNNKKQQTRDEQRPQMTRVATVVDRWGFALFTEGNLVRYCLDIGLCWERLDISWFAQKHCCKFQVGFIRYTVIMLHVNPRMHPNLLETSLQWSKALAHETHYVNNCNCKCNEVWWPVKRLQDWTASRIRTRGIPASHGHPMAWCLRNEELSDLFGICSFFQQRLSTVSDSTVLHCHPRHPCA